MVFDGCTDDSKQAVKEEFPEVVIVESPERQGSVPSRDTGFRLANGDIIVSLDDDSHPLQTDFVARVSELATSHPEAGIFAFREVRTCWPKDYRPSATETVPQYIGSYANCAGAIRRKLYGEVVSYPRFLSHMYEEPDSCLQAYGAGYAAWYEPSITVFHHASPVQRSEIGRHHLNARNELWSVILRCPLPHILWIGPFRIFRQFAYAMSNGWSWVRVEPRWWMSAASGFWECLRERKPIPWQIYWSWMRLARSPVFSLEEMSDRFYTVANRRAEPRPGASG